MQWPERVYRAALRCYPSEFRDEYGGEMLQAFRDQWRDTRGPRLCVALMADVAATAPKEYGRVLMNDLRYALRMMRTSPLFSAAVVMTVALAIAANTAIFSVVNAVLLRPLPFGAPDRLMWVAERNDALHIPTFGASLLNYLSWKEQTQNVALAALGSVTFSLSGSGDPEQFAGSRITPSLMPVLGLQPLSGRTFRDDEERPGAPAVAMISEGLWKRRFGRDPAVVGRTVNLNGVPTTVIGIAPPALAVLTGGDVWVPITIDPAHEIRLNHVVNVVGLRKQGVSIEQAQSEMDAVSARVGRQYPEVNDWGIRLVTFRHWFVNDQLETALLVLLCAVVFVLLIACANIANLLLARATAREREIAIRTAMGATRGRLLRQLLAESLVLSLLGGAAGLACALWAVRLLDRLLPANLLPVPDIGVDARVLSFGVFATVATGLLFGVAPAWQAARTDINAMLKQSGRSAIGARSRLRNGLAATELALATVLLVGAGLLVQSLMNLERARLGFAPQNVLTFQLALPPAKYSRDVKGPAFYRQLLESLRALPGVRGAAISSGIPFGAGNYTTSPFAAVGPSVLPPDTAVPINWRIVSPGFFRTLEIPLVRGRDFTEADNARDVPVIVSQAAARRFWGADDPIGRVIRRPNDTQMMTVIGVVGDVRDTALNQESPAIYYPSAARVWPLMDVVVRSEAGPEALLPGIRQKVRELDPELALATVRPMEEWVSGSAAQPRLNAALLMVFALLALVIAAIGTYGVLAYSVTQRTREIGLRMALGAPAGRVIRLIVGEGMLVGAGGIVAGLAAALAITRTIGGLLFAVPAHDPLTFGGVAAVLAIVALAACFVPARRASRVNPIVALHDD
ncbi:MAG TPA: ABC transporter permease [Vicinamibacterales bacterium]|jgi:putative ABC transport system permease protein|nr:ABC transporter permease [Vicinamibacterales bacterium]